MRVWRNAAINSDSAGPPGLDAALAQDALVRSFSRFVAEQRALVPQEQSTIGNRWMWPGTGFGGAGPGFKRAWGRPPRKAQRTAHLRWYGSAQTGGRRRHGSMWYLPSAWTRAISLYAMRCKTAHCRSCHTADFLASRHRRCWTTVRDSIRFPRRMRQSRWTGSVTERLRFETRGKRRGLRCRLAGPRKTDTN